MPVKYQKINWQEVINDFKIDCSLDIAIHPSQTNVVFLIIPGVDGSIDGYEQKYLRIAEDINQNYKATIIRINNPFISSFFWESNVRRALEYIELHKKDISHDEHIEIKIMAHSAGAAIVAQIAWEYPDISQLLLINPAAKLGIDKIKSGLNKFNGNKVTVLFGEHDPSVDTAQELAAINKVNVLTIEGADHNFTGESFKTFMSAARIYLFE